VDDDKVGTMAMTDAMIAVDIDAATDAIADDEGNHLWQ
jgi:hypothetical protein